MFIVFAGLPGVGKSTIAHKLAGILPAFYLRIDTIENAIVAADVLSQPGTAGYLTAYRLAADNLAIGHTVIADSVNPLKITRDAYGSVAISAKVPLTEVEIICSDLAEHKRRVETRREKSQDPSQPTWSSVQSRQYESWDRPRLVIDTASVSTNDAVGLIVDQLHQSGWRSLRN
ncbi:adenylyl-sulfate kinase [Ochrobactrum sp. MYb15]|uniref:AAA family ATPase n=1 Tax=Brucella TaxID=234 RepID=UPI000463C64B|nr:AAA family ATPase [Brucella rhizosphaerae]PQZ49214.1 adenylyl-sulfate kinase [Ochrobactrum sp. MYb19]PRA57579.1 adenylyl-sulfate kinase [Ochrobactrum sp. MYb68]PRA66968.1 adenylyl-sulfate kinase [Ochrobactrum sp. MYb18]PRA76002.1 adenylyl-sulfate kinase [Brucella thiophenivorans]PRA91978.1 adenylyl-sulfate kinase [Ochrobactrum sp. MYb14]PRA98010.1 adenylyl-sulfate kinase [Ochrobactrum sp. MYb15]HWT63028.1 AAA family ATPase [Ochrobactrum sp.]